MQGNCNWMRGSHALGVTPPVTVLWSGVLFTTPTPPLWMSALPAIPPGVAIPI